MRGNNHKVKQTVYIVDDEPMVIKYLETLLKGINLEIDIVGTAQNGVKAIPEIAKLRPDFVFVDVSMPIMDGLQMAEKVLQNNSLQKIFILTAYKDFNYAQKGISIGVTDYFLKNELTEILLEEVLRKNLLEIEKEKKMHHKLLENNIRNFLRENTWGDAEEWTSQDSLLQRYILFSITKRPQIILKYSEVRNTDFLDCYAIESEFDDKEINLRAFVELSQNKYCGILVIQREVADIELKCKKIVEHIMDKYMSNMPDYVCLISSSVLKFGQLPDTYYRICKTMKFLYRNNQKIWGEMEVQNTKDLAESKEIDGLIIEWKESFLAENVMEVEILLLNILNKMSQRLNVWKYTNYIQEITHFIFFQIKTNKFDEKMFQMKDTYSNLEFLRNDLAENQSLFFREVKNRRLKKYSRQIILAQEYIYQNYMKDISTIDIANAAGISEGHLRRCFKNEMNDNIVHFLADYRIDCAKKHLDKNEKSIDEIWKMVGFSSAQYFSSVFKKREGISPRDYLRRVGYESSN